MSDDPVPNAEKDSPRFARQVSAKAKRKLTSSLSSSAKPALTYSYVLPIHGRFRN